MGCIYFSKNSIDEAVELFKKVIEADSKNYDAYYALSICFASLAQWENSQKYCEEALKLQERSHRANNQMGLICYSVEDWENAIKYFRKAIKLNPTQFPKYYSNLALTYGKAGKKDDAVRIYNKIKKKFPNYQGLDFMKMTFEIKSKF